MPDSAFIELLFTGPWGRVVAGLWGAVWGSFFNVMIVRVPAGESVVRPASHCRQCKRVIAWYDNLPLLSYLLLRGRCRHCGASYSPRYFLTELLICLLTLLMHQLFVVQGSGPVELRLAQFAITALFCGVLVTLSFIDLDTMLIPDAITYPGIPAAMALSLLMQHPRWWDGLVGGVAGYLVIRLIADGYQLLTGRLGMGYGDAKLLAFTGGLLGWPSLLPTLFLASFQGAVIGITALLIVRRGESDSGEQASGTGEGDAEAGDQVEPVERGEDEDDEDEDDDEPVSSSIRHARIPFGPFLALGALEYLVLRDWLAQYAPFLW